MLGSIGSQLGSLQLGSIPQFGVVEEGEPWLERLDVAFGSWVSQQPVIAASSRRMLFLASGSTVFRLKRASGSSVEALPGASGSDVDILPLTSGSVE